MRAASVLLSHGCCSRSMTTAASRELRNQTRLLLDRVAAGEEITITVDGRAVALLGPLPPRQRWVPRQAFVRNVLAHRADAALTRDLAELAPETTDDLAP